MNSHMKSFFQHPNDEVSIIVYTVLDFKHVRLAYYISWWKNNRTIGISLAFIINITMIS